MHTTTLWSAKMIEIQLIDHGLGYMSDDGVIEINYNLLREPELFSEVLNHELSHSRYDHTLNDFLLDLHLGSLKMNLWVLKNPSTLMCLLPIWIHNKKIHLNMNITSIYAFMMIIGGLFLILV